MLYEVEIRDDSQIAMSIGENNKFLVGFYWEIAALEKAFSNAVWSRMECGLYVEAGVFSVLYKNFPDSIYSLIGQTGMIYIIDSTAQEVYQIPQKV